MTVGKIKLVRSWLLAWGLQVAKRWMLSKRTSSRLLKNSRRNCPEKGVTEIK